MVNSVQGESSMFGVHLKYIVKLCNLQCLSIVLLWKQQGQKKVTDTSYGWVWGL